MIIRHTIMGIALVILNLIAFQTKAESVTLASNGVAGINIVVPVSANSTEKFAAQVLKKYLEQMSGADFIFSEELTGKSIIACTYGTVQKITPGISLSLLQEDDYGIFNWEENVYLIGSNDRAALYAVYDFLTRLGCRWIAPDYDFYEGIGEYIPEQPVLKYHYTSDIIERPVFTYRKLYIENGLTHNIENLLQLADWMSKARFNVLVAPLDYQGHGRVKWDNWREQLTPELKKRGIIIEVGGHGYQNFMNAGMDGGRLFENYPEWFGMDKNGNRSPNPHIVFCTSNQEAVAYLLSNLLSYLKAHPEIDIFDFWPPDSETWCMCPNCEALGNPTERHARLVNRTSRFLQNECPEVKLECLAYIRYTEPPKQEFLDENVLLDFCPINQNFEHQIYDGNSTNNKSYKKNLLAWLDGFNGDISIYSYYRKYAWRSLPNIIPHYIQNDLRFYRDKGAKGISVYSEPGDWFTYGLNHYVLSRLAWNPEANVDSLTKEYCIQLYGPVANIVVSVYNELENIVRFGCKIPHTKPKSAEQYQDYMLRLESCRNKVAAEIKRHTQDEVLCGHLNRLKLMLEYAESSIKEMQFTVLEEKEKTEQIAWEIKRLMKENNDEGVFIPR